MPTGPTAHLDPQPLAPSRARARRRRRDAGRAGSRGGRPTATRRRQAARAPAARSAAQIRIGDRPVGSDAVTRVDLEVGRVKARGVSGVVDHRAADAPPGVVLAQLDRVRAADDPRLGPVERVGAGLVRDPVLVGIPERPGLQHEHPPAPAGEPLRQRGPAGAGADDQHVDRLVARVTAHPLPPRHAATVRVEQEGGVVLGRAPGALRRDTQPSFTPGPARARRRPDRSRTPAAPPSARAARGRAVRTRAGRRAHRSRSRSTPTGASRRR